jgi:hypothetical protein
MNSSYSSAKQDKVLVECNHFSCAKILKEDYCQKDYHRNVVFLAFADTTFLAKIRAVQLGYYVRQHADHY